MLTHSIFYLIICQVVAVQVGGEAVKGILHYQEQMDPPLHFLCSVLAGQEHATKHPVSPAMVHPGTTQYRTQARYFIKSVNVIVREVRDIMWIT